MSHADSFVSVTNRANSKTDMSHADSFVSVTNRANSKTDMSHADSFVSVTIEKIARHTCQMLTVLLV